MMQNRTETKEIKEINVFLKMRIHMKKSVLLSIFWMCHSVEMLKVSPCPLAQNYWWFIELPYWFKVTFYPNGLKF